MRFAISSSRLPACVAVAMVGLGVGCSSFNIEGLNTKRVPKSLQAVPRADKEPINYLMLRQDPVKEYVLDAGDVIGVFIEGVLGNPEEPYPVLEDPLGNHPPAIGYPIPIHEDGTVSLGLLNEPLKVAGLTVQQAQEKITKTYLEKELLSEDNLRLLVSLYRPRTYQVLVIREDGGGALGSSQGAGNIPTRDLTAPTQRGTGFVLDMPAYENDVLRALMETGGLPGIDAKPEVKILRGKYKDALAIAKAKAEAAKDIRACELAPLPPDDPNSIVIPTRFGPGEVPTFKPEDILLFDGDVLVVEERKRDVYYTGGLLGGGEVPLPRDYDLDVLAAIAVAGGQVGGGFQFGQSGNFSSFGTGANLRGSTVAASEVTIIREAPFKSQVAIKVSLRRALLDPTQRILIKPGDVVILNYTTGELVANLILNTFPFNTLFDQLIFNR